MAQQRATKHRKRTGFFKVRAIELTKKNDDFVRRLEINRAGLKPLLDQMAKGR